MCLIVILGICIYLAAAVIVPSLGDAQSHSKEKFEELANELMGQPGGEEYIYKRASFTLVKDAIEDGRIKKGISLEEITKTYYGFFETGDEAPTSGLGYHYWEYGTGVPVQIILNFENSILSLKVFQKF